MPTRSVLTLTDTVAGDQALPDGALNTQAAFVRALADEVERHHPADRLRAPLREQLGDELDRLAQLLDGSERAAAERQAEDARPIDVLVVDDEPDTLRATAAVLRRLGYPCRTAPDAEEALRAFTQEPAAIVLSDWCMPGKSGLDLCAELKSREPAPYVLLATAFHDHARLLDGVRGGVDDFLHKPLDLDELEARLLAASRLIRALRTVNALRSHLAAAPPRRPGA